MAEIPRGTTKKNLGLSMIKAVIFDIDGVLLDSFEANLKFFQDLLRQVLAKQKLGIWTKAD